jgi:hypothetical protein
VAKYRITWNGTSQNPTEIEADRYKAEKDWVEFFKGSANATKVVASARADQVLVVERLEKKGA